MVSKAHIVNIEHLQGKFSPVSVVEDFSELIVYSSIFLKDSRSAWIIDEIVIDYPLGMALQFQKIYILTNFFMILELIFCSIRVKIIQTIKITILF